MGDNNIEILRNFIEYAELDDTEKNAIETLISRVQAMENNIDVMYREEQELKAIVDYMAQQIYLISKEDYGENSPYKNKEEVKAHCLSEMMKENNNGK